ncbi:hypothetical protein NL676_030557 [Syzygium grande]|nr:hypothetical protein NL676_030557 [Syzygium grande]
MRFRGWGGLEEVEKAWLLTLALEFGFDEQTATKCLDCLVSLYGNSNHLLRRVFFHAEISVCRGYVGISIVHRDDYGCGIAIIIGGMTRHSDDGYGIVLPFGFEWTGGAG